MANWAWPHTPASNMARLVLADGPYAGQEAMFLPPDTAAPIQIVWAGWGPRGFTAWMYAWYGETHIDQGRTDALLFRCTGREVAPHEMPPVVSEDAETWADGADLIARVFDVPAEVIWPGL